MQVWPIIGTGVLLVLLASCGDEQSSAQTLEAADDFNSPLAEYLGVDLSASPAEMQAQIEQQQGDVDDFVTTCMAEQGFEYKARVDAIVDFSGLEEAEVEYGSDEWVRKYGFGISTQVFPQVMVGPDLLGADDSMFNRSITDPNQAYLESLSESDRTAYQAALNGPSDLYTWDDDLTDQENRDAMEAARVRDPAAIGCEPQAWSEMITPADTYTVVYEALGPQLADMYQRVEADPRIIELNQTVSQCMAEHGFEFTTMDEVYNSIQERVNPMFEAMSDPTAGVSEAELQSLDDVAREELLTAVSVLPEETRAELAVVQADEIMIATALLDCGDGDLWGNGSLYDEVRIDLEKKFVDEFQDELEVLKTSS